MSMSIKEQNFELLRYLFSYKLAIFVVCYSLGKNLSLLKSSCFAIEHTLQYAYSLPFCQLKKILCFQSSLADLTIILSSTVTSWDT